MNNTGSLFVSVITALVVWCCLDPTKSHGAPTIQSNQEEKIDPLTFGAKGDGVTDDTHAIQKMLSLCSARAMTCVVPAGKSFLVTGPLYIWGKANLIGEELQGVILFNNHTSPYLINIGISGPQSLEEPFSGEIQGVAFKVVGGEGGRILFFWRTDGASVSKNLFDVGQYAYSATSSGNDNNIVKNGFVNCIRKNVEITENTIIATADYDGSEGIGLGHFDGALILNNRIRGVGDDPIGIHYSSNVRIANNDLASVDGRIFVSNSNKVAIKNNRHERMQSARRGKFEAGISLLYIGFETFKSNQNAAPRDIQIHQNTLYYPPGSVDQGAAIYLYGPRDVSVEGNEIINDSDGVTAAAIHVLPTKFEGTWKDPESLDPSHLARVHNTSIISNVSKGRHPLPMNMSGNCDGYAGRLTVTGNMASNFQFYCDSLVTHGNRKSSAPH